MEKIKVNKLDKINIALFLFGEANYRYGFPYFNENFRKRKFLYRPIVFNSFMIIWLSKCAISLFITEDKYSILIGDFSYKVGVKAQWNLTLINISGAMLWINLVNYYVSKKNKKFKPGQVSRMGVSTTFLKARKYLGIIQDVYTYILISLAMIVGLLFSYISFSLNDLLIYGIFWSAFCSLGLLMAGKAYFFNLWFLFTFCYYSRYLLKDINQKLREMSKSNKMITNSDVLNTLRNIDVIYRKIMAFNDFWSLSLLVTWIVLATLIGIGAYPIFFADFNQGELNKIVQIIYGVAFAYVIVIGFILPICLFCSSVVLESSKTYELLNRLNACKTLRISAENSD